MRCPRCSEQVWAGDQTCQCGRYYLHPWQGGGVLISPSGTWRYISEDDRWEPLESPSAAIPVLEPPVVAELAGTPVLTHIVAEGLRQIVVPVVIQIQL